jgi:xylulokinase
MIYIGIDVGTSGLKAVAVSDDGKLLRARTAPYPTALAGAQAEQDVSAWLTAVQIAVPPVVAGEPVAAVAVTSQAPTLVAVDERGSPCGPALTWVDRRGVAEAAELADLGPDRNVADPYFGLPKLLWWSRHRHEESLRAAVVLTANGFLVRYLTGAVTLDESSAGLFGHWDGSFTPAVAEAGVPLHLLPPVMPCTRLVGSVTRKAAHETGLPAGTPVAAGGIDAVGAALEAGVLAPGDPPAEMTGFSTVCIQAAPTGTTIRPLIHTRHCFPDVDLIMGAQVSTGAVVEWLRQLTHNPGLPADADTTRLDRPGKLLMAACLAGERTPTWNPRARGAVLGLDLATTAADLLLATFEATALALRDDLDRAAAVIGKCPTIRSVGGGARSGGWLQVKADVLGRTVELPVSGHGAAYGAGLLAGLAAGSWHNAEDVRPLTAAVTRTYEPDAGLHRRYTQRLRLWRDLRDTLAEYDPRISATSGAMLPDMAGVPLDASGPLPGGAA